LRSKWKTITSCGTSSGEHDKQIGEVAEGSRMAPKHVARLRAQVAVDEWRKTTQDGQSVSGCSSSKGVLGEWQTQVHKVSLIVAEAQIGLRGGSPSVRKEVQDIALYLSSLESTLRDSNYCTEKQAQIRWLLRKLEPLMSSDMVIIDPVRGDAVRAEVIDAFTSWEDVDLSAT